jgi:hypothetical protein
MRLVQFLDNQHMKVARLSALHTSHLYPPGETHGIHSVRGPECGHNDQVNEKSKWLPSGIEPANFQTVAQCSQNEGITVKILSY